VSVAFPDLADYLAIAEAVTGIDANVLLRNTKLDLADSALHAPQGGWGDEEFFPDFIDKAAVLQPFGLPFSTPNDLTTNAFLELPRSESSLVNYDDSVSPMNGSLQGLNFAWVGGTIMEPTVSASDPASVQARSNDDFLAGVALAVAAAPLIALIQEPPRRLRPARARTDDGGTDEIPEQAKEGAPPESV